MMYRIGIDVGGTFTDLLLLDERGQASVYKTSSTPDDPAIGLLNGLTEIAEDHNLGLTDFLKTVELIVHGTTVATNAVLTRNGARTGLLTTRGFRDCLQMRRGIRESQYDNRFAAPAPLVPRFLRIGVRERLDFQGRVRTDLAEQDVIEAARSFEEHGVESVAVCFMHAHASGSHETRAAEILKRELPDRYFSVSSQLLPQIRFYDRTSTTVLNAYVGPLVERYLASLTKRLSQAGFAGVLLIMQSNGGVASPASTSRMAASTLLSGPAAGPVAGLAFVEPHGYSRCITVDMGGTSFDAALIVDRHPLVINEGRIDGHMLALPRLDIHTIGAGGGSVGWVDAGGFLRMGPRSAGAVPGPACYGRGGKEPTCTDADVVLGYLNPDYFLGGKITLSRAAARTSVDQQVAKPLGMSVEEAAAGMFSVINSTMADGIREISVKRGHDPRDFPLVVAGGAGPVHAAVIAQELEIPLLFVPRAASIFCAAGMLLSDLKHAFVRTYPTRLAELDPARLNELCAEMEGEARQTLHDEHVDVPDQQLFFSLDLRCIGQFNELNIPISAAEGDGLPAEDVVRRFHTRHDSLYGYSVPETPLEMVTVRLTAIGQTRKPAFLQSGTAQAPGHDCSRGRRAVYLPDQKDFQEVDVFDGERLAFGQRIAGPALVEQITSTLFVPTAYEVVVDSYGSFVVFAKNRREDFLERLLSRGTSAVQLRTETRMTA